MAQEIIVIPSKKKTENFYKTPTDKSEKIRVAAYCRVSTAIEAQLNSYENQVDYYTRYIEENPDYVLVGVYGDEGKSGTGDTWRTGFMSLMKDCEEGLIDLVITKSISRFARNTQDCLKYSRKLKDLGIPIIFEKEHINSMDGSGELFFTVLSSLAQEESRNISENVKWGYRTLFKQGKVVVNAKRFYGFDKNDMGILVPDMEQAPIVREIYHEFENGYTPQQIAKHLNERNIPGVYGKPRWTISTIKQILSNEKNKGDLCLQKTYVADYLEKRSYVNTGQLDKYYIENDHEPIINPDEWEAVQEEIRRREKFREKYKIPYIRYDNPFAAKIICGKCGNIYTICRRGLMRCRTQINEGVKCPQCLNRDIKIEELEILFLTAWNSVVDTEKERIPGWNQKIKKGTPLERLRAIQMMTYASKGTLKEFDKELVIAVVEKIIVSPDKGFTLFFLDGTIINM